jgi:hypothetical protein
LAVATAGGGQQRRQTQRHHLRNTKHMASEANVKHFGFWIYKEENEQEHKEEFTFRFVEWTSEAELAALMDGVEYEMRRSEKHPRIGIYCCPEAYDKHLPPPLEHPKKNQPGADFMVCALEYSPKYTTCEVAGPVIMTLDDAPGVRLDSIYKQVSWFKLVNVC